MQWLDSICLFNTDNYIWLVVWSMNFMTFHWEFHDPNWRTHIFQRGRLKPPTRTTIVMMIPPWPNMGVSIVMGLSPKYMDGLQYFNRKWKMDVWGYPHDRGHHQISSWCFGTCLFFPKLYGMSSFPVTFICFKIFIAPPTRIYIYMDIPPW